MSESADRCSALGREALFGHLCRHGGTSRGVAPIHPRGDAPSGLGSYGCGVQTLSVVQRWWDRMKTLPSWVVDGAIVLVAGAVTLASILGPTPGNRVYEDPDALSYLLAATVVLPYLLRRRFPFTVFVVSTTALVVYVSLGYNEGALPSMPLVGMYTIGGRCRPWVMAAAFAYSLAGLAFVYADGSARFDPADVMGNAAFYAAALMFGWTIRSRRERFDALEERAEALEREKEEESRRAVADERLRIAQELHDVMAHSMGVIAVQAGAGMHVIDRDPAEARKALENISATSRSTLTELRHLLGVLREETDGAGYAPAPGLADLGRLVREIEDAGVAVEVRVHGKLDLPAGVDLTAYRIVQEALTNVLKHAGPARATVTVRERDGALRIEVRDDGRGVNGRAPGSGHGLIGMRERVAVYGGTLSAGPASGGGFRVTAVLPWTADGDGAPG